MNNVPITYVPTRLARFVADYELFGDVDAAEWMTAVLQKEKDELSIHDFKVLNSTSGAFGIQFVTFIVDMDAPESVLRTNDEAAAYGVEILNRMIGDTDVSVRWVGAVPGHETEEN